MANYKLEELTFTYPNASVPALDGISLEVNEGELLLVIGPSGCGKSTLLRHFKTALTPHGERRGRVLRCGTPIGEISEREQAEEIGFVFQHPDDQIVTDKVWHELAFGLESLGVGQERMRLRVSEMASYFGLEEVFERDVAELSGGQKQLLNLASVMALGPDTLILDEPTSQLDPIAAFDFLTTVKKLNTELGITVILSEHRLEEALPFADRAAVMEKGRLTVLERPREAARKLYESGSSMFLAMPSAARISLELGAEEAAVTVNEGRRMLAKLAPEKKLVKVGPSEPPSGEPVISARGLYFKYGKDEKDVLKGLDIDVYPGRICGLVGGNGAGKSTLLSVLSGRNAPYRGKLSIRGKRMKGRFTAFDERVAVLDQDPRTVFSSDTVREELEKAARTRGKDGAEERMNDVVKLMELEELLERDPFDLSGGEQQRAAIAAILLTEPDALLLDEPTKGMDAGVKRALGEKLRSLARSGKAILIVTHDIEFCAEYAQEAGLMFEGAITASSTAREFFCSNTFYTTAANRIARDVFENALLTGEVISLVRDSR